MTLTWAYRFERKPGRWVFEPSDEARAEGAEIKGLIERHWKAPAFYFHLRRGGHVAALRAHVANTRFVKLDIADFFGCVSRSRVARLLKEFVPYRDALRMATSSTVRHPTQTNRLMLPYGFVQSPVIASLALSKSALGRYLRTLHADGEFVVTVYMDDVVVSGTDELRLAVVAQTLDTLAKRSRFEPNAEKTHGPLAKLNVFNIDLEDSAMAIAPERLEQLKSALDESANPFQIEGIRSYVKSVNSEQAATLGDPLTATGAQSSEVPTDDRASPSR